MREKGTRSNRKNIGERSEPSHKLGRERAAATLSPPQLMAQFSLSSTLSSLRSPTFFFRLRRFFSSFSPNAEPGPKLVSLGPLQLALKGRKRLATPLIPLSITYDPAGKIRKARSQVTGSSSKGYYHNKKLLVVCSHNVSFVFH